MIGSDFSQQEPRSLADMSEDEQMLEAYQKDLDLYAVIGSSIFRTSYEECSEFYLDGTTNKEGKKRRNSVKSVLLGQPYIGPFSLNVA